ncbi:MAG: DNA transposition protein, partial [Rhizobiales bacterium]|nr:DNA transposition protein [Hyphomicrobiales bacterium]
MTRRRPNRDQLDLLGWEPKSPTVAYAPERVRVASIAKTLSKAISETLKSCGRPRADVANLMSDYLDEAVSENILNAYASEARDEHIINLVRFVGLLHVTRDRRLLELIAAMFDWAVIERKHLPAIELAELTERRAEIDREVEFRRRLLKKG